MAMAAPLVMALAAVKSTRNFGINIFAGIATSGTRMELQPLKKEFTDHFLNSKKAYAYPEAIEEIARNQREGREILIISGTPTWLVKTVCLKIGLNDCSIIGSAQNVKHGRLKTISHCYGQNKVTMAQNHGFPPEYWETGYSDSISDLPFMRECGRRVLVNPDNKTIKTYKKHLGNRFRIVKWT